MAECVSEHLTSTVANFACRTAAQLCFGVPGTLNPMNHTYPSCFVVFFHREIF